jgi:hypothetical protein
LITEGYESYYHVFCLFGSSGQGVTKTYYDNYKGREVAIGYYRPNIHNCKMAICFDCWKLVEITDVKPKKTYFSGWRRYRYEIKPENLMKYHWDNECSKVTMPSAPNFEPVCISPARQEMISPTSYQSSGPSQRRSEQGTIYKPS